MLFFQALAAKSRGNDAFTKGDFPTAVKEFTEAIAQDPTDAVFYSNRSGAYASLKQYEEALADANKCVELKPEFIKGYTRQGVALFGLNKFGEAKVAYEAGLKVDPNNAALKDGLADVEAKLRAPPKQENPLGALFGPDMYVKLNANPVTREYMKDPAFVAKLQMLATDPRAMGNMGSDPRLQQALGVILGVGTEGFTAKGPGANAASSQSQSSTGGSATVEDDDDEMDSDDEVGVAKDEKKRTFKQVGEMTPEEAKAAVDASFRAAGREPPKELTPEEQAEQNRLNAEKIAKLEAEKAKAKVRAEADKEKNAGNDLYKKRDFPAAIAKYEAAIAIDPSNIVYYNNLSAVYMETKEYQKAIDTAQKGIDIGKENMAGYSDVAKAFARIGSAHQALGQLDEAIEFYNKSLVEDYNDKAKIALKKVEEERKKKLEEAYIDPAKSEEHKLKGNELFAQGKFADAIVEYTEALKRDPKNYKVYSNRANCYSKMMDWGRGLEDCEKVRKNCPQPAI